jgi:hypothetical protein
MRIDTMVTLIAGLPLLASPALALTLTGNVAADFTHPDAVYLPDPQDVGLPGAAPAGTVSGWDLEGMAFHLDGAQNRLYVGLDFLGICGDADGNGDAGSTAPWLAAMTGSDLPGLQGMEAICVLFDFDQDGQWDLVAGNRMLDDPILDGYYQSTVNGPVFSLPLAFNPADPPLVDSHFHQPAPGSPDYELVIKDVAAWLVPAGTGSCFDVAVFTGSYADAGIGEDFMTASICIADASRPAAPQLHIARTPGGSLALVWNTVPGATGYRLLSAPGPEGPWSTLLDTPGTFHLLPAPGEARRLFRVQSLR